MFFVYGVQFRAEKQMQKKKQNSIERTDNHVHCFEFSGVLQFSNHREALFRNIED